MATVLEQEQKRTGTVGGEAYTVAIDPDGLRLTGKGRRKPEVELRWHDLLSGEAAMAVALNASLSKDGPAARKTTPDAPPDVPPDAPPERPRRTASRKRSLAR